MKKLKRFVLLFTVMATSLVAACSLPLKKNSSSEESVNSSSLLESSSFESSDSSEDSSIDDSSQGDSSLKEDSSSSTEDELDEEAIAIVDKAHELLPGESLDGTYELTGKVTEIDIKYSASKGVCLYFAVKGREDKNLY